jgi:hypothetical protein
MAIGPNDLTELKRLITNTSDAARACLQRIVKGISDYDREVRSLKLENEELKKKLAAKGKNG